MSSKQRLARELLDTRRLALGHATTPQLSSSSIDGGGLGFRDPDGNDLGSIGVGDDGGFVIDYSGGPKPPKPSPPTVSADAGIFRIEWDGSFENEGDSGVLATSDTDRVEIHASMDENFVPDRVESFGGAFATLDGGSFALGPLPEAGTYYFRLVARSKSAQFSEPSERVEQELAITSIDLAVTDAWLTGDAAQVTADGKNGIWRGPEAPVEDPDVPFKDGDIWFEMTEDGKSIPNIWDDALGEWVGNDDFRQSEIERVQQELRQDLDTVITDGSGTKNFYKPVAPKATDDPAPKEGDLWFDTSEGGANTVHVFTDGEWLSLADARVAELELAQEDLRTDLENIVIDANGSVITWNPAEPGTAPGKAGDTWFQTSGNNIIGHWRHDGTSWNVMGIDSQAIANLDAGKINAGHIDAARIAANTIAADRVLIGTGGNLAPWDQVRRGETVAPHSTLSSGDADGTIALAPGDDALGVSSHMVWTRSSTQNGSYGPVLLAATDDGRIPAEPGKSYTVNVTTYSSDLICQSRLRIYWYGERASDGSYPYGGSVFSPLGEYFLSPTPTRRSISVKLPDDARYIVPMVTTDGGFAGRRGTVHIVDWELKETIGSTLIEGGAITTDKIATGAITAESGIIGSINAGTITVGEMNGARIKAQTIAADKLLIGGIAPLNTNPDFSDGLTGWTSMGSPTVSGSVVTLPRIASISSAALAVTPGQALRVRAITSSGDASSTGVTLFVYNATPSNPNGSVFIGFNSGNTGQVPGSVIGDHRVTIPAGWTHVRIEAGKGNVGDPASVYSLGAYNAAGATLIQDGSITAEHIRVGTITAESGIIGSIDANVITVGKIMANQLDADAINGKTITGATIRTASSGSRVELTQNGLKQYNSLGATIVDMTAGSFSVSGGSITGSTIKTATSGSRVEITSQGLRQYDPTGSAALILENGVVEVRNALSLSDTGRVQLLGTSGGAGEGENVTMTMARDSFGRAGLVGRDRGSGDHIGTMAWEDGVRQGLVLSGPTPNAAKDEYPMMFLSSTAAYFGMGGSDSYGSFQVSRASLGTTSISGASVNVNVNTSSGRFRVPKVWSVTGSSTGSVSVDNTGTLFRGTSSMRYKQDVESATPAHSILDVEPRTWHDRAEMETRSSIEEYRATHGEGPLPVELQGFSDEPRRHYGAIAEEVHDLGLTSLVQYDAYGRPDALSYDKFGVALIPIVRSLRDRIEQLERKLAD